ncbi:hypothetical protein [Caulobacter sp. UC70_42]|uniref:hypothetical protein n=1 Tax=Caulobacter sp. UC70_42 TaxID=3374551 RepID=UPI003756538B
MAQLLNNTKTTPHRETLLAKIRSVMPYLWALMVGPDHKAQERLEAAIIRARALKDLHAAQERRDTRKQHEKAKDAVRATCKALEVGA